MKKQDLTKALQQLYNEDQAVKLPTPYYFMKYAKAPDNSQRLHTIRHAKCLKYNTDNMLCYPFEKHITRFCSFNSDQFEK
ncbi:hypothetical protein [Zooshikella sp. RANM57]|uniref:hypothetical protein n=1 Tax=Zooshikella sp. RANM57 TaxID=3425863 RepID=UPI003D6FC26A